MGWKRLRRRVRILSMIAGLCYVTDRGKGMPRSKHHWPEDSLLYILSPSVPRVPCSVILVAAAIRFHPSSAILLLHWFPAAWVFPFFAYLPVFPPLIPFNPSTELTAIFAVQSLANPPRTFNPRRSTRQSLPYTRPQPIERPKSLENGGMRTESFDHGVLTAAAPSQTAVQRKQATKDGDYQ